ncbi:MAG: DEAD/DEAH box helicase [Candidatus Woesearchaeota archaeon]|jgi:ATP-dependent RNA helicase DeaD
MVFTTIKKEIVQALNEQGISVPTLIQEKAIPLVMSGKDVIGISRTGSGKTAAFVVPILQTMTQEKGVQALIVVPTRELAVQIMGEIQKFGKYMHCTVAAVYGGVSLNNQIFEIQKSAIIVGTPGRLLDHLTRGTLPLSKTKIVVLDEADKMAEMGFIEDISRILDATPHTRQTLLFGATISDEISHLRKKYMKTPETVKAEMKVEFLEQYYYNIPMREKFSLLVHLLKKEQAKKIIIFCSSRSTVEMLAKNLRLNSITADMIHGKLSQHRRLQVIDHFNKGKQDILIASAVAARGLDIKEVSHVYNYDLSRDPQEYVHRVGRTARAGEAGKAITLLTDRDHEVFSQILRRYDVKINLLPKEEFPLLPFQTQPRQSFGRRSMQGGRGFGGHRSSGGHGGSRYGSHRPSSRN